MTDRPDAGAWIEAAVARFEGPLTLYAARLLGGDADRARDVVQDTFLKLWTADRAAVDGHLPAWLYRVCRNGALDVRRKEVRMTVLQDNPPAPASLDQRLRHDDDERASMDSCDAASDGTGGAGGIMKLMDQLPERQQEVLRLKFQGGLSYAEIATVMDLTANHVGVLIHTAIKAIRERLNRGQVAASTETQPVAGVSGVSGHAS